MELGEYLDEYFNMEDYYFEEERMTRHLGYFIITHCLLRKSNNLEVGYIDIIPEKNSIKVCVVLASNIMTKYPSLLNDLRQLTKTFYFEKSKERIRLTNGVKQLFFN